MLLPGGMDCELNHSPASDRGAETIVTLQIPSDSIHRCQPMSRLPQKHPKTLPLPISLVTAQALRDTPNRLDDRIDLRSSLPGIHSDP